MVNTTLLLIVYVLFTLTSALASENKIPAPIIQGNYQFSFENLTLPNSEKMGLLGGNYLIENRFAYAGLGIYGAVTGQRGGFFTGGLHFGKSYFFNHQTYIDGNFYIGGGGGGSAPQGGGLMLRSALGIGRQSGQNRYVIGISRVAFPNGQIESSQISLAYSRQFSSLHFPSDIKMDNIAKKWNQTLSVFDDYEQQFSLQILNYYPDANVTGRNFKTHEKQLGVLGIRVSQRRSQYVWSEFETGGAMSGGIDGFAQVLGGLSVKKAIYHKLTLSGGGMLGAAGGGNVDTGGGLIYRVYSGVELAFIPRWGAYLHFGYTSAFDGGFSAKTINVNLVYRYLNLKTSRKNESNRINKKIAWRKIRIRPGVQKYTFYQTDSRKVFGQKNLDVDLTNLKLDAFYSDKAYITGQALGAFKGKAGGYAVGLIGAGYRLIPEFGAEILIGVAGGGGIAVGSGKIIQPMLDFELPLSPQWSVEFSMGYVKAIEGNLSSAVFNAGLVYQFLMPYR